MKKNKTWFSGLHANPPHWLRLVLAMLPFILLAALYLTASHIRHAENPQDKLLPTITKMGNAIKKVAFTEDKRTGRYLLWSDTFSSLKRLLAGISMAAAAGFLLGLNMGLLPGVRSMLLAFITFLANVPPLAILPILFISFGVGNWVKSC